MVHVATCASPSRAKHSSAVASSTGTRKTLPALARTAFAFHSLTVPGRLTTPVAPKASAERRIVPTFPGSCKPASTTINAVPSRPVTASQLHARGRTSAATACGVSVASAASSSARGASSTSVSSGRSNCSSSRSSPCAANTHSTRKPARTASATRCGPSTPTSSAPLRPGCPRARFSSFSRALCLLSTTRIFIAAGLSRGSLPILSAPPAACSPSATCTAHCAVIASDFEALCFVRASNKRLVRRYLCGHCHSGQS